jgi:MFS family permease
VALKEDASELAWQDDPDIRRTQFRTVRLLVMAQIVGGVGVGAAASLGSLLAEAVTHSDAYAGLARTSSTLGAATVGLPLALLANRRGRRAALSAGWLTAAVGALLLVLAAVMEDVGLLVVAMLLFGAGSATNLQSRYAAADLASPWHRARTLSIVVWSTTIGAVVGPNLASPGAAVASALHLPRLAGAFVISGACLAAASLVLWTWMRPDPLLLAQSHQASLAGAGSAKSPARGRKAVGDVGAHLRASPRARFAFAAIVLGHTVMGAVMTMTPVNMMGDGMSLTVVGLTISIHVLGMYGFSPIVGWLADRLGPGVVVGAAQGIFVVSALLSGLSDGSMGLVMGGLFLLGLGWSFAVVAGSAMLSEATPVALRPAMQGTSDTSMNVVAAVGAGLSGPIMAWIGFSGLNVIAGILVIPIVGLGALSYSRRGQPSRLGASGGTA